MHRTLRFALIAFSTAAVSTACVLPSFATAAETAPATQNQNAPSSTQTPAGKFIQTLGDQAISLIANKQLPPKQRNEEFSKILNDSFDLKTIGRYVIGRTWNAATPAQQQEYMELFKSLVIKNYGDRMTLYTGEGFKVVGSRPENDMDTVVNSWITHPDGSQPTAIDWRVRQKDGKIGVIDVVVEGVSLSVTQKQEYAAVIQRNDGQIDGLLQQMRAELKASTTANAQ